MTIKTTKNLTKTNENTIIIFHRSKQNAEESFINQQAFLESYKKHSSSPVISIECVEGDYRVTAEIIDLIRKKSGKIIVIINSFLSKKEYSTHYHLCHFFHAFEKMKMLSFYLMDSEGNLYQEVVLNNTEAQNEP